MPITQTEGIELMANSARISVTTFESADNIHSNSGDGSASAVEAISNGDYGWTVVFACSVVTFMING